MIQKSSIGKNSSLTQLPNTTRVRSKGESLNQKEMDSEISKYGVLVESPVFKRNCLQTIDTRKLTYEQRYAVKNPFNEIIEYINEALQTTI
jgi:hypothetical protein